MSLTGKVAIVTGSSKGLGKAILLRFAQLGANVVVNYAKDKAPADDVMTAVAGLGVKAICVQADVSKVPDIEALFKTTLDAFGKIDIVVANAGVEKVNMPVVVVTESRGRPF